uniref:Uncharacterized protein n=1 Tax=Melanopsichium pennsylvanicum 4 TaxID=1398559 RepID=A0A077QY05_9BASI|nr:uncharacterized protein BN887_03069 [Melanopsichium pennsylvanicum 4]
MRANMDLQVPRLIRSILAEVYLERFKLDSSTPSSSSRLSWIAPSPTTPLFNFRRLGGSDQASMQSGPLLAWMLNNIYNDAPLYRNSGTLNQDLVRAFRF